MSVAFRRDSDEEHLEPKFERPIANGPNLVTARGLRLIRERVAELEAALAAADAHARPALEREQRYWRTRLVTAVQAPPPGTDAVMFGSRVRVRMNGAERVLEIVGGDEADPAAGRIAFSAPLARALIGAGAGDEVAFGTATVEVIEVVADEGAVSAPDDLPLR